MSSRSRSRYPSQDQFSSLQEKARRQKRGFARIMTAAGFRLKVDDATGRSRTDWIIA